MQISLEERFLSQMLGNDGNINKVEEAGVKRSFFTLYGDAFNWIINYFNIHEKAPSTSAFSMKFPKLKVATEAMDIEFLIDELREQFTATSLTTCMEQATELILRGESREALNVVSRKTDSLHGQLETISDIDIVTNYDQTIQELESKVYDWVTGRFQGIRTGFLTIDRKSGGLEDGELITVVGRQGEGKSWICLKFAAEAFLQYKNVLYIPLEMSVNKIAYRFHTLLSSALNPKPFKHRSLNRGKNIDLDDYKRFLSKIQDKYPNQFMVSNAGTVGSNDFSVQTIAAKVGKHRPDIVFVDYITLLDSSAKGAEKWEKVMEITRTLKKLAITHNIPIVIAAQASRQGALARGVPRLEHIGYGDSIGADSDKVFSLRKIGNELHLTCIKNRDDEDWFSVTIDFDVNRGRLREVAQMSNLKGLTVGGS